MAACSLHPSPILPPQKKNDLFSKRSSHLHTHADTPLLVDSKLTAKQTNNTLSAMLMSVFDPSSPIYKMLISGTLGWEAQTDLMLQQSLTLVSTPRERVQFERLVVECRNDDLIGRQIQRTDNRVRIALERLLQRIQRCDRYHTCMSETEQDELRVWKPQPGHENYGDLPKSLYEELKTRTSQVCATMALNDACVHEVLALELKEVYMEIVSWLVQYISSCEDLD
jgi:hypothetical protein